MPHLFWNDWYLLTLPLPRFTKVVLSRFPLSIPIRELQLRTVGIEVPACIMVVLVDVCVEVLIIGDVICICINVPISHLGGHSLDGGGLVNFGRIGDGSVWDAGDGGRIAIRLLGKQGIFVL